MARGTLLTKVGLALGVTLGAVSQAGAVTLDPGDAAFRPGSGAPAYTFPAVFVAPGPIVGVPLVSPIVGGLVGSITSTVYDNGAGLTFAYVVTGGPGLLSPIIRATIGGQWNITGLEVAITDAGSDMSGSSTAQGVGGWSDGSPEVLSRSPGATGGVEIQWSLAPLPGTSIDDGDISAVIWFDTDATMFGIFGASFLDTALTGDAFAYGPLVIPLPSAGLLGLVGLCAVGHRRRYA